MRTTAEPECCGTPMVHNSSTSEWECADAYFALLDDGVLGEAGSFVVMDAIDRCACSCCQSWRDLLAHWRAVRVPDGWDDETEAEATREAAAQKAGPRPPAAAVAR